MNRDELREYFLRRWEALRLAAQQDLNHKAWERCSKLTSGED
jgi:hypothetical protein